MVSKAADRSRRQRQEIFREPMAFIRLSRCLVGLLIALRLSVRSARVAVLCRRGLTPTVEPCGGSVGGSGDVSVARALLQIDKLGCPPCAGGLLCWSPGGRLAGRGDLPLMGVVRAFSGARLAALSAGAGAPVWCLRRCGVARTVSGAFSKRGCGPCVAPRLLLRLSCRVWVGRAARRVRLCSVLGGPSRRVGCVGW